MRSGRVLQFNSFSKDAILITLPAFITDLPTLQKWGAYAGLSVQGCWNESIWET